MSNAGGLNCTCIIGGYGAYFNKNNTCSTQDDILNEGNPVWTKIISIPPVKSIQQTPIKTKDQICNDFHPNSFFNGTLNDKGALNCDCKSGYEGNDTQTECVAVSVKSSQQTCAENYGANSIWTGETNDKGGPICDCKAGYQWNQGQSSCVVIPKPKITPESSVMKKDSKFSERANQQSSLNSSVSNNDKSGNSSSIFLDKADLIYEDISTTTIERKIPEQKSVWKRVKGFLVFKKKFLNMKNNKEISIPIPNTRFIFIAEEQEDKSYNITLFDPDTNRKEKFKKEFPKTCFLCVLN